MMNYDGLLSQFTDDKLNLFERSGASAGGAVNRVEEGTVEEEQVAAIQNVQCLRDANATGNVRSDASPPQRKISTSSRFMTAFQQLYAGATNSSATALPVDNNDEPEVSATTSAACRTPSKLLSMWHNVKYGWSGKLKSNFSKEQPVWLLGRCYHRKYTPPSSMESSAELSSVTAQTPALGSKALSYARNDLDQTHPNMPKNSSIYPPLNSQIDEIVVPQELGTDAAENQEAENPWEEGIEGFRRDFFSRIWMTYRREFPLMNGSNYTSDCGWGCMLRSGQMLLAQGLIYHFLGRSWRYDSDSQLSTYEDNMHRKIIKWFGDSSSKSSPFSIHALVNLGEEMGKKPGDWYGPASVSYLLKHALRNAAQENADFDSIEIYVAKDCTIYIQDVEEACRIPDPSLRPRKHVPWHPTFIPEEVAKPPESQHWKSVIIMIPLRLGTEKLNAVYAHCLKLLLSTEYCIGIIGGRPRHSLYFVGFQEDKLIHLDPHYCQEMVDVNQENFPLQSFHCKSPRKLKLSKMDPSCCIGFYCPTKPDFDNFVESVQLYLHPMRCGTGTVDKMTSAQSLNLNAACAEGVAGGLGTQYTEMNYPLFSFSRGRCLDHERDEMSDSLYKPLQRQLELISMHQSVNNGQCNTLGAGCFDDDDGETEEFVLL